MNNNILFVCTGNTCRSIMAQGIFKKILKEKVENSSRYNIQSAGISAISGMSPTFEAITVMFEQGIDIAQHQAQPLWEDLVKKADLILVMANEHQEHILRKFPFVQNKVFLLKKFALKNEFRSIQNNDKNYEIVDPIGRPIEFYRIIAKELKVNLEKIVDVIVEENSRTGGDM